MGGCTGFFNSFKTPKAPKLGAQEKYRHDNRVGPASGLPPQRPSNYQIYQQSGSQQAQKPHSQASHPIRTTEPQRGTRSGRSKAGATIPRPGYYEYRQPAAAEQSAPIGVWESRGGRRNNNNNQSNSHPPRQQEYYPWPQQHNGVVPPNGRGKYDSVGPQANQRRSTRDSVDTNGVSPITPTVPGLRDSGASIPWSRC